MKDFIQQAIRTESTEFTPCNPRIIHAATGLATEAGELLNNVTDEVFIGRGDVVNAREEIGDHLWYLAILFDELGTDFQKECEFLLEKYSMYPDDPVYFKDIPELYICAKLSVFASNVLDHVKKANHYGKEIDKEKIIYDARLLLICLSCMCTIVGTTINVEMERVIKKLRTRFPDKFTQYNAENRDLDAEREALQ